MDNNFYEQLFQKQQYTEAIPPNTVIANWALQVIYLLFPEQSHQTHASVEALKQEAAQLQLELSKIISVSSNCRNCDCNKLAEQFFAELPELYRLLNTDIQAIFKGDPAAQTEFEVIRTYPGFYAISFYRIAHLLYAYGVPLLPRILTEHAHSTTGIDIHPAAQIGEYFHIDHGTGIVIGETSVIGNYVKLYQGVTLGALSVSKNMAGSKRHPTVQDRVVIYSGATVLGGETIIGHDSVIGGNVWLIHSVDPYSTVYHTPMITVNKLKEKL
ncbi:serine acetyltransferase [Mucilaginibacter sp. Bleaf8]|uniref:serine O-acetyltransferase EpsC n=1 Tax=Mucilaginibacter sp. Bleaf8 TaxID=2834430 RepID=UPI001BCCFD5A|nr:serine O-acetyltransferase EpsC [Mucilaginibacter sp. Bleaf8]MBS7565027.1 serine acetyltransferase [Mucilaginibacter sp. Bleaf8]